MCFGNMHLWAMSYGLCWFIGHGLCVLGLWIYVLMGYELWGFAMGCERLWAMGLWSYELLIRV